MSQQNFTFTKLNKGTELSAYTVQRDYFKQKLLHALKTISHAVVR